MEPAKVDKRPPGRCRALSPCELYWFAAGEAAAMAVAFLVLIGVALVVDTNAPGAGSAIVTISFALALSEALRGLLFGVEAAQIVVRIAWLWVFERRAAAADFATAARWLRELAMLACGAATIAMGAFSVIFMPLQHAEAVLAILVTYFVAKGAGALAHLAGACGGHDPLLWGLLVAELGSAGAFFACLACFLTAACGPQPTQPVFEYFMYAFVATEGVWRVADVRALSLREAAGEARGRAKVAAASTAIRLALA